VLCYTTVVAIVVVFVVLEHDNSPQRVGGAGGVDGVARKRKRKRA
jgi:hypothetical protein